MITGHDYWRFAVAIHKISSRSASNSVIALLNMFLTQTHCFRIFLSHMTLHRSLIILLQSYHFFFLSCRIMSYYFEKKNSIWLFVLGQMMYCYSTLEIFLGGECKVERHYMTGESHRHFIYRNGSRSFSN